ncbi:MAG: hypothetical protein QOJ07_663 [Thermoleophilaceae bacterium]|jgi:hypothetical protein|nr:hypothetical protein [Thermoleophilaceae bacterium]
MPTEPDPITLAEIARRATEICDPNGADDGITRIYTQLEDADEPVTAIQNLEERLALVEEGADIDGDDPGVTMAIATILYLAHRRDELDDDAEDVLRLAARAEFKGQPPEPVGDWLADRGVTV